MFFPLRPWPSSATAALSDTTRFFFAGLRSVQSFSESSTCSSGYLLSDSVLNPDVTNTIPDKLNLLVNFSSKALLCNVRL